ncbi:MAG: metallophosphoesterase [Halanaeroarchaeum sp.]
MLVVLSDTHAERAPNFGGALGRAIDRADLVLHAGDLTSERVLDALQARSNRFLAVHGNADDPSIKQRLPRTRVTVEGDTRIVMTHTQRGGRDGLLYFARERAADVVVSGHTHRASATSAGEVLMLNPGSHREPRGGHRTYATLTVESEGVEGTIRTTDGSAITRFAPEGHADSGAEGVNGG